MFGIGYSPSVMFTLGVVPRTAAEFFSPREQAFMEQLFADTRDERVQQKKDGLNDMVESLRLADSVNAKMALYGAMKLRDHLDTEVARLDAQDPGGAPHAALFGPKFPRDSREVDIQGKVLAVNGLKITDHQGLFGDSHWESVAADERLQDHEIEMVTGVAAGETRQITGHVLKGTGAPYIVIDDTTDIGPGDRFRVIDAVIPQDNLDKRDRSTDWMISTAIRGSLILVLADEVFATDFADAYWSNAKRILKGRSIAILDGGLQGDYLILAHNVITGGLKLEGAPGLTGSERYAIGSVSAFENGIQSRGTLRRGDPAVKRRYNTREPGTKVKLHSRNLSGGEVKLGINAEQDRIDRSLHNRFHRWYGTKRRLRRIRKILPKMNRQFEQEALLHQDIIDATEDFNLEVDISEDLTTVPEDQIVT